MRPLLVPVSLAAVAAFAADPKDPAQVAREWNKTVEQVRSFAAPANLAEHSFISERLPLTQLFQTDIPAPDILRAPPRSRISPDKMRPATPSEKMPPGAKPWRYRDQDFWLVPLVAEIDP